MAWRGLCRDCLLVVGTDAFCDGHRELGTDLLVRARHLPPTWASLVRLAWVARGEVRADADFLAEVAATLPDPELRALVSGTGPPSTTT